MRSQAKIPKRNGYVLIDALITVLIASTVFSAVIGGIATATNAVLKSRERILIAIEERSTFEKEPRIIEKNSASTTP